MDINYQKHICPQWSLGVTLGEKQTTFWAGSVSDRVTLDPYLLSLPPPFIPLLSASPLDTSGWSTHAILTLAGPKPP